MNGDRYCRWSYVALAAGSDCLVHPHVVGVQLLRAPNCISKDNLDNSSLYLLADLSAQLARPHDVEQPELERVTHSTTRGSGTLYVEVEEGVDHFPVRGL